MVNIRNKTIAFFIAVALFIGLFAIVNIDTTYAATKKIHLKKTTVTLVSGHTYKQKLINKKGKVIKATKVKWKSLKRAVARVNKKGKITARYAGKAKLIAKYKGKTYKFTVRVKKPKLKNPTIIVKYSKEKDYASVKWKKVKNAIKYEVYYLNNKNKYKHSETTSYKSSFFDGLTLEHYGLKITADGVVKTRIKVRAVSGMYKSKFSKAKPIKFVGNRSIETDPNSLTVEEGKTKDVTVITDQGLPMYTYCLKDKVKVKWGDWINGTNNRVLHITGLSAGKDTVGIVDNTYYIEKHLKVTVKPSLEKLHKKLHKYIIQNGKETKSGDGIAGDYYIQSASYASEYKDRVIVSTSVDSDYFFLYCINDDGREFSLIYNDPEQPKGTNSFDITYSMWDRYWGDFVLNKYSAKLYGSEEGIINCEKTGPEAVTDTNELYKMYRAASESMKSINTFLKNKMGYGLKELGYSKIQ